MLLPVSKLANTPVMSIHTGSQVAQFDSPLIDPTTLKIAAYKVKGAQLGNKPTFLRIADIREMSSMGMIIDTADELVETGDVIKIDELYDLSFGLIGKPVVDESNRRIGKADDYSIDTDTFMIQKLHVKQGLLKRFSATIALIDRSQIVEVNDSYIVVKSTAQRLTEASEASPQQHANYVNPFRKPANSPQPETLQP